MPDSRSFRHWGPDLDRRGYFPAARLVVDRRTPKKVLRQVERIRETAWVVRVVFPQSGQDYEGNQPSSREWQRIAWLDRAALGRPNVLFTDHGWTEVSIGKGKRARPAPACFVAYYLDSGKAAKVLREALRAADFPKRVLVYIRVAGRAHGPSICDCARPWWRCPVIADALACE